MTRKRTVRATVLGVAAATAVLLTGCGPMLAGAAAVVGQTRITDDALGAEVDVVTSAIAIEKSGTVSAAILNRMVTQELIFEVAEREGVSVSDETVDAFIAEQEAAVGGKAAFEARLLEKGIPPSAVFDAAKATVLVAELGAHLAPGKQPEEQELATVAAVTKASSELDTRVSPRFGGWDPELLQVTRPPDDLSIPAPRPEVTALSPIPTQ